MRKANLDKARARAEAQPTPAPSVSLEVTKTEVPTTGPAANLAAPKPLPVGHSPLHPSLPPKPGTPSKLANSSQESPKAANVLPIPPTPTVPTVPATSNTPVPLPAATTPVDPIIARHEEVSLMVIAHYRTIYITILAEQAAMGLAGISYGPRPIYSTFW